MSSTQKKNKPPPSSSSPTNSIVEYFYPPESKGHRCGYCKSPSSNFSHGMWAHTITPENYERLINIGWRRSGSYLYKPMNEKVCCPMYTIRNLATSVEISRSQRKVLKRFRKYIADGVVPRKMEEKSGGSSSKTRGGGGGDEEEEHHHDDEMLHVKVPEQAGSGSSSSNSGGVVQEVQSMTTATTTEMIISSNNDPFSNPSHHTSDSTTSSSSNQQQQQQSRKQHPLKRKYLRRERKRQKLIAKGEDPEAFFKRNERNRIAELENFFTPQEGDKLRFTTKLVKVDDNAEFEQVFQLEHALYQKYQMHTHGDNAHECRASQFKRFLCDNPFSVNSDDQDDEDLDDDYNNDEKQSTTSSFPQGTYHQHYYVNNNLIAVGVVDILPHCVSSVYFFYDPDYSFLSPGTLGALQEIAFVNSLNRRNADLQYYYLGFYIHSCVKMKYKRKFRPCQLVCPISYEWVRFDERVVKILDKEAYALLLDERDAAAGGGVKSNKRNSNNEDVHRVLLLYNRRIYEYAMYPHRSTQHEELQSYVNLVSGTVASNMLLYRSSSSC